MRSWNRRKAIILFSALIAVALTSTSAGQVIVDNVLGVNVSPAIPGVHLSLTHSNYTALNTTINQYHSHAYVNVTANFLLKSSSTANISNILNLNSSTSDEFGYLTNVTEFNGQKTVTEVSLYSFGSNGSYSRDFQFASGKGYSNNTAPVLISSSGNSTFGLLIQEGVSGFGGPYTWSLNFTINGYFGSSSGQQDVFTQYFVTINVTTFEGT